MQPELPSIDTFETQFDSLRRSFLNFQFPTQRDASDPDMDPRT